MTYKQIVDQFQAAADAHLVVKSFNCGPIDWLDNPQDINFPLLFLRPLSSPGYRMNLNGYGSIHVLNFELYALDVPHLTDGEENIKILSSTEQYLYDILSWFNFGLDQQLQFITVNNITPVHEAFNDRATGWVMNLQITSPAPLDFCTYPFK